MEQKTRVFCETDVREFYLWILHLNLVHDILVHFRESAQKN